MYGEEEVFHMLKIRLVSKDRYPIFAKVDDEDFETLSGYKWTWSGGYAITRIRREDGSYRYVLMHRMIVDAPPGSIVDHVNRDKLDNQKANLRLATVQQNNWNRSKSTGLSKSEFLGVSQYKSYEHRWCSTISIDGMAQNLGVYDDEEEAAYIRDQFAMQLRGEFALLNFEY